MMERSVQKLHCFAQRDSSIVFRKMSTLTKGESKVLLVLLLLVVSGLVGKAWLRTHPPRELPPLPVPEDISPR